MIEYRVLRMGVSGSKKYGATGRWRDFHSEELQSFLFFVMRLGRMSCAIHVTYMGEMR
jgi:hypothetical protein